MAVEKSTSTVPTGRNGRTTAAANPAASDPATTLPTCDAVPQGRRAPPCHRSGRERRCPGTLGRDLVAARGRSLASQPHDEHLPLPGAWAPCPSSMRSTGAARKIPRPDARTAIRPSSAPTPTRTHVNAADRYPISREPDYTGRALVMNAPCLPGSNSVLQTMSPKRRLPVGRTAAAALDWVRYPRPSCGATGTSVLNPSSRGVAHQRWCRVVCGRCGSWFRGFRSDRFTRSARCSCSWSPTVAAGGLACRMASQSSVAGTPTSALST